MCIIVLIVLFVLVGLSKTGKGCGKDGNANRRIAARVGVIGDMGIAATEPGYINVMNRRRYREKWVKCCELYKNEPKVVENLTKDQKDLFVSGCDIVENDGNYVRVLEDMIKTDELKVKRVLELIENKNVEINTKEEDDEELIKKLFEENMTGEDDFNAESDGWDFDSIEDLLNDDSSYSMGDDIMD